MIALFLLAVVATIYFSNKSSERQKAAFDKMHLEGIITDIYRSSGGVRIYVNNSKEKIYIFSQSHQYSYQNVGDFVEKGDSVYKAVNSNLISIFRDGKSYEFEINE